MQRRLFIYNFIFGCAPKCQSFFLVLFLVEIMKLYSVSDGPPSLSCRMVLKALDVPFDLVPVNFNTGEHLTENYHKVKYKFLRLKTNKSFILHNFVGTL